MKRVLVLVAVLVLFGCASIPPPQPVSFTISTPPGMASVEKSGQEKINKSMSIDNEQLQFKRCRILGDSAYMTIADIGGWGSSGDELWSDFQVIREKGIKKLKIFLLSGGGAVYQGLSMSDEIRLLKADGITVFVDGRGIIASAAVPVFMSASKGNRIISKNTTFMLHPAKLYKQYSAEDLKDLQSQAKMIKMINDYYVSIIVENSNLTKEQAEDMISKDTWINADEALKYGLVDEIK